MRTEAKGDEEATSTSQRRMLITPLPQTFAIPLAHRLRHDNKNLRHKQSKMAHRLFLHLNIERWELARISGPPTPPMLKGKATHTPTHIVLATTLQNPGGDWSAMQPAKISTEIMEKQQPAEIQQNRMLRVHCAPANWTTKPLWNAAWVYAQKSITFDLSPWAHRVQHNQGATCSSSSPKCTFMRLHAAFGQCNWHRKQAS